MERKKETNIQLKTQSPHVAIGGLLFLIESNLTGDLKDRFKNHAETLHDFLFSNTYVCHACHRRATDPISIELVQNGERCLSCDHMDSDIQSNYLIEGFNND